MNQFYSRFNELMDEWINAPKSSRQIINCIVQFLAEDVRWLDDNISKVDRETLVALVKRLEGKEEQQ